jgi:16S rRNA (guanine527-N7)-methyltransferase
MELPPAHAIQIDSEQWLDLVMEGAVQLNLDLTRQQAAQFAQHARMVLEWNGKVNLTAITDSAQMAVKHFLDALAPMARIPIKGELLDIGTGAGFPGIPLKIMRPVQPVTLIDGTRKKISFVKQVIRELGLEHVEALHQRAEQMAALEEHAGRYSVIVSRALADINEVVMLAKPLLATGGTIVIYKGPGEKIPETLRFNSSRRRLLDDSSFQVATFAYELPFSGDRRKVVLLRALT